MSVLSASLGFPRIGPKRELKRAVESYWKGNISAETLDAQMAELRRLRWTMQRDSGLDFIPSNDFSLYDHVLDTAALFGSIPERFAWDKSTVDHQLYFAMARGGQVPALEMTKWFDTNYHYLVPEFHEGQTFQLSTTKPVDEFREALQLGIETVPVILGPISFLLLGKSDRKLDEKLSKKSDGQSDEKSENASFDHLSLLPNLLTSYVELLNKLAEAGAHTVQMDEPCLALDRTTNELERYREVYESLSQSTDLSIFLTTYFAGLRDANLSVALSLPVAALHLDFVRGEEQVEALVSKFEYPQNKMLSLGLVDGRNVWKADLARTMSTLKRIQDWREQTAGTQSNVGRLMVAPSCSLVHVPWDADLEVELSEDIKESLSFAKQKLDELQWLKTAMNDGVDAVNEVFEDNRVDVERRRTSRRIHNAAVGDRLRALREEDFSRSLPFASRKVLQQKRLNLPAFPTTTIGSLPQTDAVRNARSAFRKGTLSLAAYEQFLKDETAKWVREQESLGIDVLVHGEFERTDMVEYFGEQLEGFVHTKYGWVQSYGTRCVKPPIIYGDVSRLSLMTVKWSTFAKALTDKPMKGMLTGPVTILQWSFVRDDQPRDTTCLQIALAIREEVLDLEQAGLPIIQIDEPALREGLPLHQDEWGHYLKWAVDCFRLATSGVRNDTQIHTHMCYAEFNDIMQSIQDMDADVISIETSRSNMELLNAFKSFSYKNDIGPGVYDIHSPRVPSVEEMEELLQKACEHLEAHQLWVNPDCGLKTRGETETVAALSRMVEAASNMRKAVNRNEEGLNKP